MASSLARDGPSAGPLEPLRWRLIEDLSGEVERACGGPCAPEEAPHLAVVLSFLAEHGWRPQPGPGSELWRLWERLADGFPDAAGKRRMLAMALRYTERLDHDEHVRQRLTEAEDQGP
jgi:hypothetical protein